ncbi:MAG: hypothetical protein RL769_703 [Pseudomonadota bacterium]|jgi:hypothetical protein
MISNSLGNYQEEQVSLTKEKSLIVEFSKEFFLEGSLLCIEYQDLWKIFKENPEISKILKPDSPYYKIYQDILTVVSFDYFEYSYFSNSADLSDRKPRSTKSELVFDRKLFQEITEFSPYYPVSFDLFFQAIAKGDLEMVKKIFNLGYDFFNLSKNLEYCFHVCSPFLIYDNFTDTPDNIFFSRERISSQEDCQKYYDLNSKKFQIFKLLYQHYLNIENYEEFIKSSNDLDFPVVFLSYSEEDHKKLLEIILKTIQDFKDYFARFPQSQINPAELDAIKTEKYSDSASDYLFCNPYFLLAKFVFFKFYNNAQIIKKTSQYYKKLFKIDRSILIKSLVLNDYDNFRFFSTYHNDKDRNVFLEVVDKYQEMISHYCWHNKIYHCYHKLSDIDIVKFAHPEFPEEFPKTLINLIIFLGDERAFKIALNAGISLSSDFAGKNSLPLFLKGFDSQGFFLKSVLSIIPLDDCKTIYNFKKNFYYNFITYGGDIKSDGISKSQREDNLKKLAMLELSPRVYELTEMLEKFSLKIAKLAVKRTKIDERISIADELIALSSFYLDCCKTEQYNKSTDCFFSHNNSLLVIHEKYFQDALNPENSLKDFGVEHVLNHVGFIEYLNRFRVLDFLMDNTVQDKNLKEKLKKLSENLGKIFDNFCKKSLIYTSWSEYCSKLLISEDGNSHRSLKSASRVKNLSKIQDQAQALQSVESKDLTEEIAEKLEGRASEEKLPLLNQQEVDLINDNRLFELFNLVLGQDSEQKVVEKFQIIFQAMPDRQKTEFVNFLPYSNINFLIISYNCGYLDLYHELLKSKAKIKGESFDELPIADIFQKIEDNFYYDLVLKCFIYDKRELLKDLMDHEEKPLQSMLSNSQLKEKLFKTFVNINSSSSESTDLVSVKNDKLKFFSDLIFGVCEAQQKISSLPDSPSHDDKKQASISSQDDQKPSSAVFKGNTKSSPTTKSKKSQR